MGKARGHSFAYFSPLFQVILSGGFSSIGNAMFVSVTTAAEPQKKTKKTLQ